MYDLEIIRRGDYSEVIAIRMAVFVDEQGFSEEIDGLDDDAWHCLLRLDGRPIATARAFLNEEGICHIGRVAVVKDMRGKQVGRELIERFEEEMIKLGAKEFELGAQVQASGFYKKLGYTEEGEIYYDEFCPHINMRKKL